MMKWNIQYTTGLRTPEAIIEALLKNRGVETPEERERFLHPSVTQWNLQATGVDQKEIEKANARIIRAIEKKEPIVVYADYDVDGVCACALIWETLHELGASVMPYIPIRQDEGYGLSHSGIEKIKKQYDAKLLITVDHGITAEEEIDYAKAHDIETIIIDHHALPKKIPDAVACVHTQTMCTGGIAWFFSNILRKRRNDEGLELAALATIADLVPLKGTNRMLSSEGIKRLRQTKRVGLRALMEEAGIVPETLDTYHIGYILAPRINAMGRLTHALDALRLICTRNTMRAKQLAAKLSHTNRVRQEITEKALAHARNQVREKNLTQEKIIILSDEIYHQGIIGLIAGKITQEFYRPTIVIAKEKGVSKASARSIPGFDIIDAIRQVKSHLTNAGGHPLAAGFSVPTDLISKIEEKLHDIAAARIAENLLIPSLSVDAQLPLSLMSRSLYHRLSLLAPFGIGNPKPVFVSRNVRVLQKRRMGRERKHIRLTIAPEREKQNQIEAVGFNMSEEILNLNPGERLDIAYALEENRWNGNVNLQLNIRDIKIAD